MWQPKKTKYQQYFTSRIFSVYVRQFYVYKNPWRHDFLGGNALPPQRANAAVISQGAVITAVHLTVWNLVGKFLGVPAVATLISSSFTLKTKHRCLKNGTFPMFSRLGDYVISSREPVGHYMTPTQTRHYYRGNPFKLTIDLYCLIHRKWGNLMTPWLISPRKTTAGLEKVGFFSSSKKPSTSGKRKKTHPMTLEAFFATKDHGDRQPTPPGPRTPPRNKGLLRAYENPLVSLNKAEN